MAFLERLRDFPSEMSHLIVIIINGLKDHFATTLNSLRSTRTIWEKLQIYLLCILFFRHSSSLKNIMAVKFSWLDIGIWKPWQAVILFTLFCGWPYPDISWPEINSFSFICKFYFQFQLICYLCSEHCLGLPNERWRRQRLESIEIEQRPIVSTYKLLKNLNPVCKF